MTHDQRYVGRVRKLSNVFALCVYAWPHSASLIHKRLLSKENRHLSDTIHISDTATSLKKTGTSVTPLRFRIMPLVQRKQSKENRHLSDTIDISDTAMTRADGRQLSPPESPVTEFFTLGLQGRCKKLIWMSLGKDDSSALFINHCPSLGKHFLCEGSGNLAVYALKETSHGRLLLPTAERFA
ncbi:hypothetical protein RRG08_016108 [Elysia crispata]|uniref:Uncharacterized protein n=1 Tax=Elysia crispata TaxID=231223 RepID=A0AAE1DJE6_9GAST|nr:hypothetical protein RRG08_016108 [Elysia crispata]